MKFITETYLISEQDYAFIYKHKASNGIEQNLPVYQIAGLEDPLRQIKTDYASLEELSQV